MKDDNGQLGDEAPKSRLQIIREAQKEGRSTGGLEKRGRLVVSLTRLVEDPKNERKTYRNMDGLIASMKANGLIEPLTVIPLDGGDQYQILTGHRRYRAAKEAGLEQVEVLIRDPEDERTCRLKSIVSNVQREDVGAIDLAEALQSLLDENDAIKNQRGLAGAIGKHEAWVSGMLRILTLPVKLQKKLRISKVSVPYDIVMRIARVADEEQQKQLIDLAISGAGATQIREKLKEFKGSQTSAAVPSVGKKPKKVFDTSQKAAVIIQSETTEELTRDQMLAALQEAMEQLAALVEV